MLKKLLSMFVVCIMVVSSFSLCVLADDSQKAFLIDYDSFGDGSSCNIWYSNTTEIEPNIPVGQECIMIDGRNTGEWSWNKINSNICDGGILNAYSGYDTMVVKSRIASGFSGLNSAGTHVNKWNTSAEIGFANGDKKTVRLIDMEPYFSGDNPNGSFKLKYGIPTGKDDGFAIKNAIRENEWVDFMAVASIDSSNKTETWEFYVNGNRLENTFTTSELGGNGTKIVDNIYFSTRGASTSYFDDCEVYFINRVHTNDFAIKNVYTRGMGDNLVVEFSNEITNSIKDKFTVSTLSGNSVTNINPQYVKILPDQKSVQIISPNGSSYLPCDGNSIEVSPDATDMFGNIITGERIKNFSANGVSVIPWLDTTDFSIFNIGTLGKNLSNSNNLWPSDSSARVNEKGYLTTVCTNDNNGMNGANINFNMSNASDILSSGDYQLVINSKLAVDTYLTAKDYNVAAAEISMGDAKGNTINTYDSEGLSTGNGRFITIEGIGANPEQFSVYADAEDTGIKIKKGEWIDYMGVGSVDENGQLVMKHYINGIKQNVLQKRHNVENFKMLRILSRCNTQGRYDDMGVYFIKRNASKKNTFNLETVNAVQGEGVTLKFDSILPKNITQYITIDGVAVDESQNVVVDGYMVKINNLSLDNGTHSVEIKSEAKDVFENPADKRSALFTYGDSVSEIRIANPRIIVDGLKAVFTAQAINTLGQEQNILAVIAVKDSTTKMLKNINIKKIAVHDLANISIDINGETGETVEAFVFDSTSLKPLTLKQDTIIQ